MSDPRTGSDATDSSQTALDNKLLHSVPAHSSPRSQDYNPYNYSDNISPFNKSALKEAMFDDDADQFPDGRFGSCCQLLCSGELVISEAREIYMLFYCNSLKIKDLWNGSVFYHLPGAHFYGLEVFFPRMRSQGNYPEIFLKIRKTLVTSQKQLKQVLAYKFSMTL